MCGANVVVVRGPSRSDGLLMRGLDAQKRVTHPDNDTVVSLEFGEKQISAHNLRLVERAKATQHFYVALSWDIGHCADSERRKDAASVGRKDAAEAGGESLPNGALTDGQNKRRSDSLSVRPEGSDEGRWVRWINSGGQLESLTIVSTQRDGGGVGFFFSSSQ